MLRGLTRLQQYLAEMREIPTGGIAVFQCDTERWIIKPSAPLVTGGYFCGRRFHLDPLSKQQRTSAMIEGLTILMISGEGWFLFCTRNGAIKAIRSERANLPNRHGKGGQSAPRFQRKYTEKRLRYLDDAAERAAGVTHNLLVLTTGRRASEIKAHPTFQKMNVTIVSTSRVPLHDAWAGLQILVPTIRIRQERDTRDVFLAFRDRLLDSEDAMTTIGKHETAAALNTDNLAVFYIFPGMAPRLTGRIRNASVEVVEIEDAEFRDVWGGVGGLRWYSVEDHEGLPSAEPAGDNFCNDGM